MTKAELILEDGTTYIGEARGYRRSTSGEVVFTTGMTGYDLAITDPSFAGQILAFTYPLIGNWGVPPKNTWESDKVHPTGLIISDLAQAPNHWQSTQTLEDWLTQYKVPAIIGIDTRALTQKLRNKGTMLGKIEIEGEKVDFNDPNTRNLVAEVSPKAPKIHNPKPPTAGKNTPTIALLNCGAKRNIAACLTKRGAKVIEIPWNYDPFTNNLKFDGLMISNGPGDPKMAKESIAIIKKTLDRKIPTFGICLGNQLLALAAGGDTYKLKFGHRAQNQPTIQVGTNRCYITTQNHGFAVDNNKLPNGFKPWFINANDNTNEGIIHEKLPFFSVQFHPESFPGPTDTQWLFDHFLEVVHKNE